MLGELRRAVPGVGTHVGTAESIPLPDASVDVVLVAQAWHWVDPARAVPEIARVLTPGGRLGLIWNLRDERADWVRRLGTIIGREERRGLARALMQRIEGEAAAEGRDLLTLDAPAGDAAEALCRRSGWQEGGRLPGYTLDADGTAHDMLVVWKCVRPAP